MEGWIPQLCFFFSGLYWYTMWWLVILGFTSLCYLDSTSNTIHQLIKLQKGQWYSHPLWHPKIRQAAAKGCECEWICCCLLYLQGNSLTYFDWTAFFKLRLFLTGACMRVLSHPLICVWAATKRCECEWNCCWHLQLQGNSLTRVLWLNCFP